MNPIDDFKQACYDLRNIIKGADAKEIKDKDKEILKEKIAHILASTIMNKKIDDQFGIKNFDKLSKKEIHIAHFKSLANTITKDNKSLKSVLNRLIDLNMDSKKELRLVRFDQPESAEESPSAQAASAKEMSIIEKKDQLISSIYEDFETKFTKNFVRGKRIFPQQENVIRFYKENLELAMRQIVEPNQPIPYSKEEAYPLFVSLLESLNRSIDKMDEIDVDNFKILAGGLIEGRSPSAYSEKDSNILELVKNYKEGKLKSGEKVKIYYTVIKEKDLDESLPIVKKIVESEEFIALFNQLFE